MHSAVQILANADVGQKLFIGNPYLPWIDPKKTIAGYNLTVHNTFLNCDFMMGDKLTGSSKYIDNSKTVNISFQNCSFDLQEELNGLAREFDVSKNSDDIELVKKLKILASDLDELIKKVPAGAEPSSVEMDTVRNLMRRDGLLKRLKAFFTELKDEDSELYKKIDKIQKGAKALWSCYNAVAPWLGSLIQGG